MTTEQDIHWLKYTIALAKMCPVVDNAFAVGATIVDSKGKLLATGFSRETDLKIHAEEAALQKIQKEKITLSGATLYSSLEPCNKRLSKLHGCAELIIHAGIKRVVFAALEPPIFVPGGGMQKLQQASIEVITYPHLTDEVIANQSFPIQKMWKKIV